MIYHFNNVDPSKFDSIIEPLKVEDEAQVNILRTNEFINQSNSVSIQEKKIKTLLSFSEKFELILEADSSICKLVFPKKQTILFFGYIIIFICYLYIGAAVFTSLEIKQEKLNRWEFKNIRKDFLTRYKCLNERAVEKFITQIESLTNQGISPRANASTSNYNWKFPNAVFFVTTLVTTIGYGNNKPVTTGGKVFCILFVIIGVPMMMVLTSAVVERLYCLVELLSSAIFYKMKFNTTEENFRKFQILVCYFILIVFFLLLPAFLFAEGDKWTYLDSLYYCIISLTTIGLGDYVPSGSSSAVDKDIVKILATVYLFVALLWISFCIRIFHRYGHWNFFVKLMYLDRPRKPRNSDFNRISYLSGAPSTSEPSCSRRQYYVKYDNQSDLLSTRGHINFFENDKESLVESKKKLNSNRRSMSMG